MSSMNATFVPEQISLPLKICFCHCACRAVPTRNVMRASYVKPRGLVLSHKLSLVW